MSGVLSNNAAPLLRGMDSDRTSLLMFKQVAKLQAEIDALEYDPNDGSGHRLNRTSDADDVDPIKTPPANTAEVDSDEIQVRGILA